MATTSSPAPETTESQQESDNTLSTLSSSLVADANLSELHDNVAAELNQLQPKIDELEEALSQLQELKQQKQRLIALKLSLESIINQPQQAAHPLKQSYTSAPVAHQSTFNRLDDLQLKSFYPDEALAQIEHLLPRKDSLNYHFYKAIVYYGGKATTEEIRQYLIDNEITYPTTGQTFDDIGLSQVSSRVNYLIRKNIARSMGGGIFVSNYGWRDS
jgi:chromosome segregation ATPase